MSRSRRREEVRFSYEDRVSIKIFSSIRIRFLWPLLGVKRFRESFAIDTRGATTTISTRRQRPTRRTTQFQSMKVVKLIVFLGCCARKTKINLLDIVSNIGRKSLSLERQTNETKTLAFSAFPIPVVVSHQCRGVSKNRTKPEPRPSQCHIVPILCISVTMPQTLQSFRASPCRNHRKRPSAGRT